MSISKPQASRLLLPDNLTGEASSGYAISLYYKINDEPGQGLVKFVTGNVGSRVAERIGMCNNGLVFVFGAWIH